MKKLTALALMLFLSAAMAGNEISLKFDNTSGLIIKPDEQYLAKGLKDDKKNRKESAIKNFTKSAEYGNYIAMSMLGWYHLNDKEYIKALAWLQLVEIDKLPNKDHTMEMISKLEAYLRPDEMEQVKALNIELRDTYGLLPTLLKREAWKKNIKVTGTRNKGQIPLSASFSLKGGIRVNGGDARNQVDKFVYEYKFSDLDGRVTLSELEEID